MFVSRRLGYRRRSQMCLSFIGYEGSERHVAAQRRAVGRIVKRHGGLCIGSGPGALYDQKKFDTPHIRDFLLDRGAAGDVSETAMPWSRLTPVYDAVIAAAYGAFAQVGVQGYLMCHLSHSYHAGACLYFTFAFEPTPGGDMLAEYDVVKSAIQQAFVDNGATLSHHHAVGTEHAQWLEQDISAPGRRDARGAVRRDRPGPAPEPGQDRLTRRPGPPGLGRSYCRIVIRDTSPSRTANVKWLGPLNPRPPTCAAIVVSSPDAVTPVTSSVTSTPMNSRLLQPLIASAAGNSRPQSSTTPSSVKLARNAQSWPGSSSTGASSAPASTRRRSPPSCPGSSTPC